MNQWLVLCLLGSLCSMQSFALSEKEESLHLDWRDLSVSPSKDFYHYANGQWQKNNPIPPEYSSWGAFSILSEQIEKELHELVLHTSDQKIKDFYQSGMDTDTLNRLDIKPLLPLFKAIEGIHSKPEFAQMIAHLHLLGLNVLFEFGNMQDYKNSQSMIGAMVQGGLTLPDRSYYLSDDPEVKKIRTAYGNHLIKMLILSGESSEQAKSHAQDILQLETQLAKAALPNEMLRDCEKTYHKMNISSLEANVPSFEWFTYFKELELSSMQDLNVLTPDFFKKMDQLLQETDLETWKSYLRWHVLSEFSYALSDPFVKENFHMKEELTGVKKELPRWKRVLAVENEALGFALGELYVRHYVPKETKTQVSDMLHQIRLALAEDLKTLPWMAQETKQAALKKLTAMEQRIGYPERWRDYSHLDIHAKTYAQNIMNANVFNIKYELNKIGKPIDKIDWAMTPQTVNAYYDFSMNYINFPAAILRPPFFDPKAPMAVNYGAIGAVIGHEITHGFDDQGAKFDMNGNLKNWWTEKDLLQFQKATQCISDQFSNYPVLKNVFLRGPLVVGEATADLGGILLAYRAFHASKDYPESVSIENLTPDQQFFLSFAHVWASNIRSEQARHHAVVDPHPAPQYRVNGTLANIPEFNAAFNVPIDKNQKQCSIW